MDILVTGGAGYVGSGLILKLGEAFPEATIKSIDNLSIGDYRYIQHLKKDKRYHLLVGDVTKKSDLRKVITEDLTAIIHAAAVPGVETCNKQPRNAIGTNIYGTHLLLEEAVKRNVERFIFTSSAAVYGTPKKRPITETHPLKPMNLYGVTKAAAEMLLNAKQNAQGLNTTILRLSNVYGLSVYTEWKTVIPRFVWQAVKGEPLTIRADGKQQRDFVHVDDIVNAVVRCLEAPLQKVAGETFNIGGEALSVNKIAELVIREAKKRVNKKTTKVFTSLKGGEVYTPQFEYSHERASEKIGYEPRREMLKGVSELFDYTLSRRTPGRQ